jgi:L-rhamnose mutarotase
MSGPSKPRRLGQVIELREECVQEYTRVHADGFPGVRDLLAKWHLHNFSIFMATVAGKRLLFLYAEYTGDSYESDMAGLSAEPRDVEWHKLCDPMQASFNPTGGWLPMECVSAPAAAIAQPALTRLTPPPSHTHTCPLYTQVFYNA